MTQDQKQVRDWMLAFGQECPEKPVIPSLEVRKLRAKLILEEALETIEALDLHLMDSLGYNLTLEFKENILDFEEAGRGISLKNIADGCEDLKVVTEGTLVACGLVRDNSKGFNQAGGLAPRDEEDPLFNEVMRSNNSKVWSVDEYTLALDQLSVNPNDTQCTSVYDKEGAIIGVIVKDKDGKIIKPPSYSSPNLQPIIDEMSK